MAVSGGEELTFDPVAPGAPAAVRIDPGRTLATIACSSTTQCTAVDRGGYAITFDPSSPRTASHSRLHQTGFVSVSCPSATQCTAVGGNTLGDYEVTFDPQAPESATTDQIDTEFSLPLSVACASVTQCVAVEELGELTFNPRSPPHQPVLVSQWTKLGAEPSGAVASDVSCQTTAKCTAVAGEDAITFDPSSPRHRDRVKVDAGGHSLLALACSSTSQCTGVDGEGREVTFDPATGPLPPGPTLIETLDFNALPYKADATACPSASQRTTVDNDGATVTFDPTAPGAARRLDIDPNHAENVLSGVACPSIDQCTAVDAEGREVTFDPRSGAPLTRTAIHGSDPVAIVCHSVRACVALAQSGAVATFDPRSHLPSPSRDLRGTNYDWAGLACPANTECIAVGDSWEETFDPARPQSGTRALIDGHGLVGVSCPTARQCTAVDDDGGVVTFDPRAPLPATRVKLDRLGAATAISCPASSQCTVVSDVQGKTVTFDPRAPDVPGRLARLAGGNGSQLRAIACASTHSCVAVDDGGNAVTGDPDLSGSWHESAIDPGHALTAVACTLNSDACVALDDDGRALLGLRDS